MIGWNALLLGLTEKDGMSALEEDGGANKIATPAAFGSRIWLRLSSGEFGDGRLPAS
jgi:hypothetical protein